MKVVIATDAWTPQINGVVTTYSNIVKILESQGHQVRVIHPGLFRNLPCPFYKQIPLALSPFNRIRSIIKDFDPDFVHIATEGPIGVATRRYMARNKLPFTTSYHTKFPDYVHKYTRIPRALGYFVVRWFHNRSKRVMVPTQGVADELRSRGFRRLVVWTRGVDTTIFRPGPKTEFRDLARPVFLYCGRVSSEKSIEDFLRLDLPGSKVVVGDGPAVPALKEEFPSVTWVGFCHGEALADHYRSADVFVFPSRTDTFGIVLLEALACGIPVAAYPVTGPKDVITDPSVGCLNENLRQAALTALEYNPQNCARFAQRFAWDRVSMDFMRYLWPIKGSMGQTGSGSVRCCEHESTESGGFPGREDPIDGSDSGGVCVPRAR